MREIKRDGLHAPIVVLDGQILEGRRRHRACLTAGMLPEFRQYGDDAGDRLDDPEGWAREHCDRLLSAQELSTLREAETVIDRGIGVFVDVGQALQTVRDERLYRQTHATFQAWCEERYSLSRRHADRTIQAAHVVQQLGPTGPTVPRSEAVARELAALREDPAALREAWTATLEAHGDRPTAAQTRGHVTALLPDPPSVGDPPARTTTTVPAATVPAQTSTPALPTGATNASESGTGETRAGEDHADPWGRDRPDPVGSTPDPATVKARALVSLVRDSAPADPRQVAAKLRASGEAAAISYLTDLAAALR